MSEQIRCECGLSAAPVYEHGHLVIYRCPVCGPRRHDEIVRERRPMRTALYVLTGRRRPDKVTMLEGHLKGVYDSEEEAAKVALEELKSENWDSVELVLVPDDES